MKKTVILLCVFALMIFILPELSHARGLNEASREIVNQAKTIARSLSVLGVIVGGIIFQIPGLAMYGRSTMGAGLMGCACSFGGPILIQLIQNLFGA